MYPTVNVLSFDATLAVEEIQGIEDKTQTNLINLRRVIYLTIMNALNYEEAVHKLLKVQIKEGQEVCTHLLTSHVSGLLTRYADRTVQDGHRMLFSRTVLFNLLRSYRRTFLQTEPRMV